MIFIDYVFLRAFPLWDISLFLVMIRNNGMISFY